MNADARHARGLRGLVIAATAVSVAVFVALHWARQQGGQPIFLFPDYLVFWSSGPALRSGGLATLFQVESFTALQNTLFADILTRRIHARPWLYPPTFLLVSSTFALLPYLASALCFQLGGLLALVAAMGRKVWPLTLLVLSPAFGSSFDAGQISAWLTACVIGGLLLLDTAPVAAGLLFAVMSFKPHLFVLVPVALMAARAWRALAACLLGTLGLVVASVAVFGVASWQLWLSATTGPSQLVSSGTDMLSIYGVQMGSVLSSVRMLGASNAVAWSAQALSALVATGSVWWVFTRSTNTARRALTLTCATLLTTPYWMNYDLLAPSAAVVLAVSGVLSHARRTALRDGEALAWLTLWLLPYGMLMVHALWHVQVAPVVVFAVLLLATLRGDPPPAADADLSAPASSATPHATSVASRT